MPQPRPFAPDCTRYAPEFPFPPYRHVPGETPHPHRDPRGHSYGLMPEHDGMPLTIDGWPRSRTYLIGADLFNHAYWWEAHEWWEALWRPEERRAVVALYLQGLIQISAGFIKWHQGNQRGVDLLHGHGRRKLEQVCRSEGEKTYMGLDLPVFLERLDRFTRDFPIASPAAYADPSTAPLLRLVFD